MTLSGAFELDLTMWDAWRPDEATRLLAEVQTPWYTAAGWAIDLFLGGQRREHEDLEIAVPQERFSEIASVLGRFELFIPIKDPDNGLVVPFTQAGDLVQTHHQTWVRDPGTGRWLLDIFRESSNNDTWVCSREQNLASATSRERTGER